MLPYNSTISGMSKMEATNLRLISKITAHIGSRKIPSLVSQGTIGYYC